MRGRACQAERRGEGLAAAILENLQAADVIPLAAVRQFVPSHRTGGKVSNSTVRRWAADGVEGVILESFETPYGKATTLQALAKFLAEITLRRRGGEAAEGR